MKPQEQARTVDAVMQGLSEMTMPEYMTRVMPVDLGNINLIFKTWNGTASAATPFLHPIGPYGTAFDSTLPGAFQGTFALYLGGKVNAQIEFVKLWNSTTNKWGVVIPANMYRYVPDKNFLVVSFSQADLLPVMSEDDFGRPCVKTRVDFSYGDDATVIEALETESILTGGVV